MLAIGEIWSDVSRHSVFILLRPCGYLSFQSSIEICVATQHHEGVDEATISEFDVCLQVVADH